MSANFPIIDLIATNSGNDGDTIELGVVTDNLKRQDDFDQNSIFDLGILVATFSIAVKLFTIDIPAVKNTGALLMIASFATFPYAISSMTRESHHKKKCVNSVRENTDNYADKHEFLLSAHNKLGAIIDQFSGLEASEESQVDKLKYRKAKAFVIEEKAGLSAEPLIDHVIKQMTYKDMLSTSPRSPIVERATGKEPILNTEDIRLHYTINIHSTAWDIADGKVDNPKHVMPEGQDLALRA